jgi:hypothetical protein
LRKAGLFVPPTGTAIGTNLALAVMLLFRAITLIMAVAGTLPKSTGPDGPHHAAALADEV